MTERNLTADALRETLISPNEVDRNHEAANVVDGLFAIARAINGLSQAVRHLEPQYDASDIKDGLLEVSATLAAYLESRDEAAS